MPTFKFLKSGDFAYDSYELKMKQRVMNFHDICNSPILIFIIFIIFLDFPKAEAYQRGFLKSKSVECM